jgi:hypothetical protein
LALGGELGSMRLRGGYRPGGGWSFDAPVLAGTARGAGERSRPGTDIWVEANTAAVGTFVGVVRGDISTNQAVASGLCPGAHALLLEQGLEPLFALS